MGNVSRSEHNTEEQWDGGHFIVPKEVLRTTVLTLIFLTVLTVVTAKFMDLGIFAGTVAFFIAFVKAMLVMMYFMGLKYDAKMNRWIFSMGFIFLVILAFFSVLDIWTRVHQSATL
ncbi:MAG: cytochrome C oxidase subunit IV family protein [Bdellovibrionaceae bacterium]|nr:cytochrome C oxidase subunit IV family protein [Pseudobdellovibrionaceae bacterium]MDW8189462.1 cytochrome C oxidase subunit IV family protein [Pseudobdellovibrionaceae bacterium]